MADSIIRKTFKYRIYPNKEQTAKLTQTMDLCRELYNGALQERRDAWRLNRVHIYRSQQSRQLPDIKQIRPEFSEIYSQVLCDVVKRADIAFQSFFRRVAKGSKRAGFPRYKGVLRYNSFTYHQGGFRLFGLTNHLRLSKIGHIKVKLHRPMEGKVKTLSICRQNEKWYAHFVTEMLPAHLVPTYRAIGIDVGIESFATLSDGTHIPNGRFYEQSHRKLRVAQRRLRRRKKGTNRRKKALGHFRDVYNKIANQRNDFHHKLASQLIQDNDLIAIEKLDLTAMGMGTFSKQIFDASWGNFFHHLKYKAEYAGRRVVEVDPRGTSQTCTCGATVRKDLSVRWHDCSGCGLSQHRDIVSAKVILQRAVGQTVQDLTCRVAESVS